MHESVGISQILASARNENNNTIKRNKNDFPTMIIQFYDGQRLSIRRYRFKKNNWSMIQWEKKKTQHQVPNETSI